MEPDTPLHIHVEVREGRFVATVPELPGCRGVGPDSDTAVRRVRRAVHAYLRPPPSPFATVRKRLAERAAGI